MTELKIKQFEIIAEITALKEQFEMIAEITELKIPLKEMNKHLKKWREGCVKFSSTLCIYSQFIIRWHNCTIYIQL